MDTLTILNLFRTLAPMIYKGIQSDTQMLNTGAYQENKGVLGNWSDEKTLSMYPNIKTAVNNQYDIPLMNDYAHPTTEMLNKQLSTIPEPFPSASIPLNPLENNESAFTNPNALKFLYQQLIQSTHGHPEKMPATDAALTFAGFYK